MEGRLYRSKTNSMVCGVCGGLGEYFNIDANLIRFIWAVMMFCGGTGFLAYIIAVILLPEDELIY